MTLMLMGMAAWAEQTVTVSANSSDISEGLDLKVVAKLFAEAKNLEEFETTLNNPDSAFCNLDLNGDGQVDYLRVVETGEGNKRLIVLQAVLAKDIYQDVASIYVEKDESDQVSVQIVGDEYVYGTAYIIERVYVYRPLIYDWFWSPYWYDLMAYDWYWRHCYAWHHHHHCCSFRHAQATRRGYNDLRSGVSRRDYAAAHPDRSFSERNAGMRNAGDIRRTSVTGGSRMAGGSATTRSAGSLDRSAASRTYGSTHTAATRSAATTRTASGSATTRTAGSSSSHFGSRSASANSGSRSVNAGSSSTRTSSGSATTRSSGSSASYSTRSASTTRSASSSSYSTGRSASGSSSTRTYSGSSSTRSSSSYSGPSRSSSSSSYSGSRSSGGYSGGGSRSSGGFSGGGGRSGGGGGASTRR